MIILEGPDNSGKTTLALWLAEQLKLEYRRPPTLSSTEGVDQHVFDWWEQQLLAPDTGIYDRCTYISDPIYRLVSGRKPIATDMQMNRGIRLVGNHAMVIFCLPEWEWSKPLNQAEKDAGGGLAHADMAQLEVIHWAYGISYMLWAEAHFERILMWDPTWDKLPLGEGRLRILGNCKSFLRRQYGYNS